MNTYKNSDVSKIFGVAPSTVTLWVKNAMDGKNNLQLVQHKDKFRLARSQHNDDQIVSLKNEGNKYKPHTVNKIIRPLEDFYKTFNREQVSRIINDLIFNSEIAHKYTYFNVGSEYWQDYIKRTEAENLQNTISYSRDLVSQSFSTLKTLVEETKYLNIVDIGSLDYKTTEKLADFLEENHSVKKIIGVSINSEISNYWKNGLEKFQKSIEINNIPQDIQTNSIQEQLFYATSMSENGCNIITYLQSQIENQADDKKILLNLKESMNPGDKLLITRTINSVQARTYFDLWTRVVKSRKKIPEQERVVLDLLNITEDCYEPVFVYDEKEKSRIMKIKLNFDTELNFENDEIKKHLTFPKNTEINIWRHQHNDIQDIVADFKNIGFDIRFMTTSKDLTQAFFILEV